VSVERPLLDALVAPGWGLADAELTSDRLHVRWGRHTAWAEVRVTRPGCGKTAPRFRDLTVCDVHARTSDGASAAAVDAAVDRVVDLVTRGAAADPSADLAAWLGGGPSRGDLTDALAVEALMAPTWRRDEPLADGWRWVDSSPRGDGGWVLEVRRGDDRHHVELVPEPAPGRFRVVDYRVAGEGSLGEARARARLALGLVTSCGGVRPAHATPAPETPAPVLSAAQREHFDREGYVVVPSLIEEACVGAVREAIRWFLGLDPTFDGRWFYEIVPYQWIQGLQRSGNFLELYQHQALWDIRQHPGVHQVFSELWGRRDLWVSLDRVNMKPPVSEAPDESWRDPGFVHWDVDTDMLPLPFGVQGLVALTDAAPAHGGFHCAPGMHLRLEEWAAHQRADRDPRRPEEGEFEMVPVPLKAGDLLVWHHGLPHGNGENRADDVRMVQYVAMSPAEPNKPQARADRIKAWRDRLRGGSHFEGDPLEREERHGTTATLTPLGRRLLGLERWETGA
jgi:hypothetical protein